MHYEIPLILIHYKLVKTCMIHKFSVNILIFLSMFLLTRLEAALGPLAILPSAEMPGGALA